MSAMGFFQQMLHFFASFCDNQTWMVQNTEDVNIYPNLTNGQFLSLCSAKLCWLKLEIT